jgi:hypothetical protein
MTNNNEKEAVLSKIIKDPIFATGELYQEILRYLFACHQRNYQPKEIDIAVHVFGKKEHFDPAEDTLVRVYFYRLRKKLDQYYSGPGKNDSLKLTIPKGHHYFEFKPASFFSERKPIEISARKIALVSVIVLLLTAVTGLWFQNRGLKRSRLAPIHFADQNIVWSDFVKNKLKTSIVVGDIFSFYLYKPEFNREWLIRDDQINSFNELQTFIQEARLDPSRIYLPGWDIVPKSSVIDVLRISNTLSYAEIPIEVKITSEVTLEDIGQNNIVFIGHFHNLKHLSRYLPNTHFFPTTEYRMSEKHPKRTIRVVDSKLDTLYRLNFHYGEASALNSDYVLVSRVPGPNNNVFLFIVSFLPLGRIEAVKMLTNEVLFSRLTAELRQASTQITPYFEMLIEVNGQEEKGFETRIKHFFPLSYESPAGRRK